MPWQIFRRRWSISHQVNYPLQLDMSSTTLTAHHSLIKKWPTWPLYVLAADGHPFRDDWSICQRLEHRYHPSVQFEGAWHTVLKITRSHSVPLPMYPLMIRFIPFCRKLSHPFIRVNKVYISPETLRSKILHPRFQILAATAQTRSPMKLPSPRSRLTSRK
jgi:hypothetical protein